MMKILKSLIMLVNGEKKGMILLKKGRTGIFFFFFFSSIGLMLLLFLSAIATTAGSAAAAADPAQLYSTTLDVSLSTQKLSSSNEPENNVTYISISTADDTQVSRPAKRLGINDPNLELQLVFRGLENPSNMEFLGPDDILVLQKNDGTVRRIVNGTMLPEPVLDVGVANQSERGMLGIAVARDQNYVFLYYTEPEEDGSDTEQGPSPLGNRLYRYELVNGKLTNPKLLLDLGAPRGVSHNGGKVLIGPDNNIYLVIGDTVGYRTLTQNYQNSSELTQSSVIFRITSDGQSAGAILGNAEPANKYYAYGIRNSFGMDFDPLTGKLWDTENGPEYGDEINLVEPGFNSGWRIVSGMSNLAGNLDPDRDLVGCLYCSLSLGIIDVWVTEYFTEVQKGTYSEPEFTWMDVVGPTAIKFFNSDKLGKQYENGIFVGDIVLGNLYHFRLNENRDALALNGSLSDKVANSQEELDPVIFAQGFRGITDIDVGPDGYLYFLTYYEDGAIYRIVPKGTPAIVQYTE
jgi:aldose sugar dehydrogenase